MLANLPDTSPLEDFINEITDHIVTKALSLVSLLLWVVTMVKQLVNRLNFTVRSALAITSIWFLQAIFWIEVVGVFDNWQIDTSKYPISGIFEYGVRFCWGVMFCTIYTVVPFVFYGLIKGGFNLLVYKIKFTEARYLEPKGRLKLALKINEITLYASFCLMLLLALVGAIVYWLEKSYCC